MGRNPITPQMLTFLKGKVNAAWLGALILADGEVSYMSSPANGKRYFRARVRVGIYEREPIAMAAALMGVALMGPRKGRYEAEAQGSRAVAVIFMILPYLLGRKSREALYVLQHGGQWKKQSIEGFKKLPVAKADAGETCLEKWCSGRDFPARPFEFAGLASPQSLPRSTALDPHRFFAAAQLGTTGHP